MRTPFGSRGSLIAGLVALLLVSTGGCGRDQQPTASHLDSPTLAETDGFGADGGVPVVCYHYFRKRVDPGYLARVAGSLLFGLPALGDKEFWTLSVEEFAKQLAYFRDEGITVMTLDEVAELEAREEPLPTRAVVLTIDDADVSVYKIAYPLLRELGMRAHLFVPTAKVGESWYDLNVCSWEQLREMEDSGVIILESHSNRLHFKIRTDDGFEPIFWHPADIPSELALTNLMDLKALTQGVPGFAGTGWQEVRGGEFGPVTDDLLVSRARLAERAGATARWLAWPYGYGNGDLDSIAALAGFSGTVSLMARNFGPDTGSWHVGRYAVTAKTTLAQIKALFPNDSPNETPTEPHLADNSLLVRATE